MQETMAREDASGRSEKCFQSYFAPQVPVEDYRIDFLVASCIEGTVEFTAIECGGPHFLDTNRAFLR
jgi:hypothetical protein